MPEDVSSTAVDLEAIERFIRDAKRLIEAGSKEDPIRANLVSHVRPMFPGAPSWITEHISGGEAALRFHKERRDKAATGFVDNLVGLTAIEYEKDLRDPGLFKTGENQVRDYCAGLLNQGRPADQIVGVLSDSIRWHAYAVEPVTARRGRLISGADVKLRPLDHIDASAGGRHEAEKLADFLTRHLQRLESRPLAAASIGRDLGFDSEFARARLMGLTSVVDQAFSERPDYAKLVEKLWMNFVSHFRAKDAIGFDRADYVRELYLLTLGKLICANALMQKSAVSDDEELSEILGGGFFQRYGLLNFVEYDYFGWLNTEARYRDVLIPIARDMQRDLRAYDFRQPPQEDIFGTLMSQLASASQRLLLGQEWTPSWLAGRMVTRLFEGLSADEAPRFIDMCSGSGSMMVEVVKQAKARLLARLPEGSSRQERVTQLGQAVTGFDIDPLAVMLSKISWVLAARDWLGDPGEVQVAIPAYHADTLFAMTPLSDAVHAAKDHITLEMEEHSVRMPRFLVSVAWQPMFDALIEKAYELAHADGASRFKADEMLRLTKRIAVDCGTPADDEKLNEIAEFLRNLADAIGQLSRARRNGIWSFIIRNSYRPGLVFGQFNGLVSNPPWLTLSKTSRNPYEQALKLLATSFGQRPKGAASIHVEMSVIFLLHAIMHYLRPDAVVGCVLPETILNGDHLRQFRTGAFRTAPTPVPFSVSEIWQVDPKTFKNRAAVIFGRKQARTSGDSSYPMRVVQADRPDVRGTLNVSSLGSMVVWAETSSILIPKPYKPANFRQGADLMPRTLFFHEVTSAGSDRVSLQRIPPSSPTYFLIAQPKKCKTFALPTPTVVPRTFLQKAYTSNQLAAFTLSDPVDVLLPIKRDAAGVWVSIDNSDLDGLPSPLSKNTRKTFELLGKELIASKKLPKASNPLKAMWDAIDTRKRKATSQRRLPSSGYLVVYGAGGGNVCAAVLPLAGRDAMLDHLIIDQTLYWTHTSSEKEALYLVGALNSTRLNEIIKIFQPKGLAQERHVHKLALGMTPPYDPTSALHAELVWGTRKVAQELDSLLQHMAASKDKKKLASKLTDPNSALPWRRKEIKKLVESVPAYRGYAAATERLYTPSTDSGRADAKQTAGLTLAARAKASV